MESGHHQLATVNHIHLLASQNGMVTVMVFRLAELGNPNERRVMVTSDVIHFFTVSLSASQYLRRFPDSLIVTP